MWSGWFQGPGVRSLQSHALKVSLTAGCRARALTPAMRYAKQCGVSFQVDSYLVDPASSHMLVSKIKPCMSKFTLLSNGETANGSLNQSRFLR